MTPDQAQAAEFYAEAARIKAQQERKFCPRCGKRLACGFVDISIHTCTPLKKEK